MSLVRYPPLPIRQEWAPSYLANRPGAVNRDFAFHLADPQGCYPRPPGFHGAVDWFAPAGTEVRAPSSGTVTRAVASTDTTGQVFGGITELTEPTGLVWVMRHTQPELPVGAEVRAGDVVARVARWDSGGSHLHLEVWKGKAGGYTIANMVDPADFTWDADQAVVVQLPQRAQLWMEELPHSAGGLGPVVHGGTTPERARKLADNLRGQGLIVSTLAATNGLSYALSWAPGSYGDPFRFGPWAVEQDRDRVAEQREAVTGRRMRRYRGAENSIYPWPKEG